jgi:hypothetical protein
MRRTSVAVLLAKGESPPDGLDLVSPLADVHLVDDARTLAEALRRVEVMFVWDFRTDLLKPAWPDDRAVRWIHTGSIGVDVVLVDPVLEGDIVFTNTRGVFERPIAEPGTPSYATSAPARTSTDCCRELTSSSWRCP